MDKYASRVSSIEGHEAHVEEPPFLLHACRNQLAVTPCRLGPGAVPSVPPAQFASPDEACATDRKRRQRGAILAFGPHYPRGRCLDFGSRHVEERSAAMSDDSAKGKTCFRYRTAALRGAWKSSEYEALCDALRGGQAYLQNGRVILFEFASIEEMPAERCSECDD